ncbi:MAG: hypothetical protein OXI91_14925 [Chloroflexota bacterium]|nr:hypothetical protein [Chloroflexota bacterium]
MTSVIRAISAAAKAGRFCWRHKRLTLALAVGLLIVAPLLTGSGGGTFFLNLLGLGIAALVVWRIARAGKGRQAGCRCNCNRRNTNTQQQGGTP